jgi:hypothetical protein
MVIVLPVMLKLKLLCPWLMILSWQLVKPYKLVLMVQIVLPVVTTQSAPLALTCRVSPVAKIRSLAKDKVTLT